MNDFCIYIIDILQIKEKLENAGIPYQYNDYFLNIHLENNRVILFHDGRGIVYDIEDVESADNHVEDIFSMLEEWEDDKQRSS